MQEPRKLQDYLIERPEPRGIDVLCGLKHFAIITYAVPAARFEGLFPSRFQLDTVDVDGQEMGLMSVVPFVDVDFTSAVFPFPKFTMGQTNYRIYIIDTETGELVWAWDLGNPDIDTVPPTGETYTRGTPNVWSTPSFDADLGLVYLPTGNAQPDFYGSARGDAAHAYSSSVVALDAATGKVRWSFQTTHRDIWDYDVPSQPLLYDLPDGDGGTIPALIQLTKRGQIFVLDRRDGTPLTEIEERGVPTTGGVEPDFLSSTQPYPVGFPSIGTKPLTEARMWGATPLDQLYCRIAFRRSDYAGDFTPLSERGTLIWPGYFGGMNWGSGTVDEERGLLIVNDSRIVHKVTLVPRAEAESLGEAGAHDGLAPQAGADYAAIRANFLSPLGVPCQEPPYGTITAIDLAARDIVWQTPVGTVEETGHLGIRTGLRMPVGMPLVGGPISTAGGVTFFAGTQDYYLRAFDSETGEELWKGALPVGSQATPMTYIAPESGRQVVIVAAVTDKLLPYHLVIGRQSDPQDREQAIDNERRLLYVALTRAREEVHVTWHRQPSRFLADCRPDVGS